MSLGIGELVVLAMIAASCVAITAAVLAASLVARKKKSRGEN